MREHGGVPVLESVKLAAVRDLPGIGASGIDKQPVRGPVRVDAAGLAGDSILNTRHHGGPDKAVYAYAGEDLDRWAAELDTPVGVGENLVTRGLDVSAAVIGERWRIGSALFEVAQPRTPCERLRTWWGRRDTVRRFVAAARPGAYLRVITPGELAAGDEIVVIDRPAHGVTSAEVFRAVHGELDLLPHVLRADQLPPAVRAKLRRRLTLSTRS